MSFAGVSVITDGKLLKDSTTPTFDAGAASGYHLLVIQGHSRCSNPPGIDMSHSFTIGGHIWQLLYVHCGNNHPEYSFFMSLHLPGEDLVATNPVKVQLEFSFGDETDKQEPARIRANNIVEFGDDNESKKKGRGRFFSRESLEKCTHPEDDCFTIRCDVVVLNPTSPFIPLPPCEMQQNLTDLLLAGEGSDVAFRVGGETFSAHRCILAARSAVFKALLFGPMKEGTSKEDVVQIDDMEATVFKALLEFIYGDSLPVPAGPAPQGEKEEEHCIVLLQHLLVAADRYGLQRLRAMCEKKLCEHIGVTTATTILALAEHHHCDSLKAACYEFLHYPENLRAVVATDGFDHLCRSCPPVMKDLILGMLQDPK